MTSLSRRVARPAVALLATGVAGAASAADLGTRYQSAPVYRPPAFTWTGAYGGLNIGFGFDPRENKRNAVAVPGVGLVQPSSNKSDGGFVGGAQVGYNYQSTPGSGFVFGVEADIQYFVIEGKRRDRVVFSGNTIGTETLKKDKDGYLGTARLRVGYAFDRTLVYATGGLAYGEIPKNDGVVLLAPSAATTPVVTRRKDKAEAGFVVGVGTEYAVTDNLSLKVEGLYVDLKDDKKRNPTVVGAVPVQVVGTRKKDEGDLFILRAGMNYRF